VNLERLYIENYKQLRDPVELFPPEGAVGVVGSNGAGKSTLFESILWAFFGSKGAGPRFANESIPWSGGSTKDPTIVEVTLTTGNGPYTVRRQLRSNATTAEARDAGGRTVVTGAADVTRWVEEELLRMDRTTFEATFYAKQKELRFFAHDDGISRVRRISKMLSISGVEVAQQFLRSDRNELRSEARVIEARLAEADLEALQGDLEKAKATCKRLEDELEKVSGEYEEAEEELKGAREARSRLDAAYREHTRLTGELREAEADRRRAEDRAAEAQKDLKELVRAEEELATLKPELERLPELEAELERLEDDRRRAERRETARRELREAQSWVAAIESEVADQLEELDGDEVGVATEDSESDATPTSGDEPLPGWDALFELDGPELLAEAAAVLEGAAGELARAEERYEELRELAAAHEDFEISGKDLREAEERHEEALAESGRLAEELDDVSGGEDLEKWELELRGEEEKLKELAATHRGRAAANEREAKNVDKAREAIDSGAEDHCPTCHRGFEDGEQGEISDTLRRQAAALRRLAARENEEAEKLATAAAATEKKLRGVSEKLARWRGLREALARAEDRAAERFETLERIREHRRELEGRLDGAATPTEGDLVEAEARRERLRTLRDARPGVVGLAREHAEKTGRAAELVQELEGLAGLAYDPEVHAGKRREKARLDESRGRAGELERRLATRPEVEKTLEEARWLAGESGERAEGLRREVSALGFDEAAYEAATERVTAAEERAGSLRDTREHLGGEWKDAEHRIERANTELGRLDADRKLANRRASEAARMDEMDSLFTLFFKSLTARARPMLEAEASALVRELTDNRYERMEFDENYRVKLLDRFDDSYAIDRFSGGEADVVSLSARVALSKIIAARGGGATLGFLILDEVFGSLDANRRNNVMLALEHLKRSFGQIFIISHVAEVQESALVDEVWILEEDESGKSTVRRVEQNLVTPVELGSPGG
jgi:DNA repair protein SbcC/Rad50